MISDEKDPLNFDVVNGITIYDGTTKSSEKNYESEMKLYDQSIAESIFTELVPSTLTAKGQFSNVLFNEEQRIHTMIKPEDGYIVKIGCNFGEIDNPSPNYVAPVVKRRVSNRGRKPKAKPKSNRKVQGSGKYFSSQITFFIYCQYAKKIYKLKLFRNGGFQVPGVNKPDMSDLMNPIQILTDYLAKEFKSDVKPQYLISVMRNYICKLKNPNYLINLNILEKVLIEYKLNTNKDSVLDELDDDVEWQKKIKASLKKSLDDNYTVDGIAEIHHNSERYFGLIIKFYRPVPWKKDKKTTIKILRSGKINVDGGNSVLECYCLYHWLAKIIDTYKDKVLYDITQEIEDSDEYDCGSGYSIYDDDLN